MSMCAVTIVVEGDTDVPVARKIVEHVGLRPGDVHDKAGKTGIDTRLSGYLAAARHAPWLVLRDLDQDAPCAPVLLEQLSVPEGALACVRIPVRAIESWLLADSAMIAAFFRVRSGRVPAQPDAEPDPKLSLVRIAGDSTKPSIRRGMVPRPGSGRRVGPLYEQLVIEFATQHWRPAVARRASPSLERCVKALQRAKRTSWKLWCS